MVEATKKIKEMNKALILHFFLPYKFASMGKSYAKKAVEESHHCVLEDIKVALMKKQN